MSPRRSIGTHKQDKQSGAADGEVCNHDGQIEEERLKECVERLIL
jgi:hypothetical protein